MKTRSKRMPLITAGILLVMGLVATGCNQLHDADVSVTADKASNTPYADVAELERMAAKEGIVDWRVARFFALTKMLDFAEESNWEDAKLSKYPLIIYRAENDTPRYYEFRVIKNGTEVGAITCVVEKEEGEPVQYILPFAKKLKDENARAVRTGTGKLIDAGYPGALLSRAKGGARLVNVTTGEIDTSEYTPDAKALDFLKNTAPEELEALGITSELYGQFLEDAVKDTERVDELWKAIDAVKENMIAVSDEEILKSFSTIKKDGRLYAWGYKTLVDWQNKTNWKKPSSQSTKLWCGPYVDYFITIGLGTKSGYSAVPLYDSDYTKKRDLYNAFERKIGPSMKLYSDLDSGLRSLTNYKIVWDVFHDWNKIDRDIRYYNLPALSLRLPKKGGDELHYRVITGTHWETEKYNVYAWFFGWHYAYSFYLTNRWYCLTDNGWDGGTSWWEMSGRLYHLSSAHVERK